MAGSEDKDQKTEPATPRRRSEARQNGQVAQSTELVAALMLITGLAALALGGGGLARATGGLCARTLGALGRLGTDELDVTSASLLLRSTFLAAVPPLLAVFVPAIAVGLLAGYGQVGFMVTPKAIELDPQKVSPMKGFGRIFGMRGLVRTGLAAAKVGAIAGVMSWIAYGQVENVARVSDSDLGPLLVALGRVAIRTTVGGLIAILALALVDFVYQRFQYERDMRMSKQEIKEENRIAEGDPHVKAKIRSIQREVAMRRMMADVPKATVIVTNPTHYAVALRYDRERDGGAPVCVAKGKGEIARRIKELGREAGVALHEDVPLARALYAQAEIGREIPEDLYGAVAEVLAYVYRMQGRTSAA